MACITQRIYNKNRVIVCSQTGIAKRDAFLKYKADSSILFDFIKTDAVLCQDEAQFLYDQETVREKSIMGFLLTRQITNIASAMEAAHQIQPNISHDELPEPMYCDDDQIEEQDDSEND